MNRHFVLSQFSAVSQPITMNLSILLSLLYLYNSMFHFSVLETPSTSQQSSRHETKLEQSGHNKSTNIRLENFDIAFGDK